jgi:preprotein translocase subunit SecY
MKSQILKEFFISLAVITIFQLLGKIPLPFINLSELMSLSEIFGGIGTNTELYSNFTLILLGIMPYVSACLIVEFCSLSLPFLKKHRGGDYIGRKILHKYSLALTVILILIQGTYLIQGMVQLQSPSGIPVLEITNNLEFIALLCTMTAAVFIVLLLAEISTKHGIGNGISLIILSGFTLNIGNSIPQFFSQTAQIPLNFFHTILLSILVALSFLFIPIVLLKTSFALPLIHKSDEKITSHFQINACLSGNKAIGVSTSILTVPFTLLYFMEDFSSLGNIFEPGTIGYFCALSILVFFLSYLLAWLFFHPERRLDTLHTWGWSSPENHPSPIEVIRQKSILIHLPWAICLCCIAILPNLVITGSSIPFYLGGASIVIIAFIGLDLIARVKLWIDGMHEKTYKLAEFQDVHYARMIKNHLLNENIHFYMQGYYHRHLLYFFGPYIPINLMVPLHEKRRTLKILNRYYGNLGLVEPFDN